MASGLSLQSGLQVQTLQSKAPTTTSATATTLGGIQSTSGRYACKLTTCNKLVLTIPMNLYHVYSTPVQMSKKNRMPIHVLYSWANYL